MSKHSILMLTNWAGFYSKVAEEGGVAGRMVEVVIWQRRRPSVRQLLLISECRAGPWTFACVYAACFWDPRRLAWSLSESGFWDLS